MKTNYFDCLFERFVVLPRKKNLISHRFITDEQAEIWNFEAHLTFWSGVALGDCNGVCVATRSWLKTVIMITSESLGSTGRSTQSFQFSHRKKLEWIEESACWKWIKLLRKCPTSSKCKLCWTRAIGKAYHFPNVRLSIIMRVIIIPQHIHVFAFEIAWNEIVQMQILEFKQSEQWHDATVGLCRPVVTAQLG